VVLSVPPSEQRNTAGDAVSKRHFTLDWVFPLVMHAGIIVIERSAANAANDLKIVTRMA